jgi:hypothetical protein
MSKSKAAAPKKTIKFETLLRLSFCNSKRLPRRIVHHGKLKEWVGIGWITPNDQTLNGKETHVVD